MTRQSQTWKNLERQIAKSLGGKRILRGDDYSQSKPDVFLPSNPNLIIDCKYRQNFNHHQLFKEIKNKYCTNNEQIPILITKQAKEHNNLVTIDLEYFKFLLEKRSI